MLLLETALMANASEINPFLKLERKSFVFTDHYKEGEMSTGSTIRASAGSSPPSYTLLLALFLTWNVTDTLY